MAQEAQPSENGSENRGRTGLALSPSAMFDFRFQPEKNSRKSSSCRQTSASLLQGRAVLCHPNPSWPETLHPLLALLLHPPLQGLCSRKGHPEWQWPCHGPAAPAWGLVQHHRDADVPIPTPAMLTLTALPSRAPRTWQRGEGRGRSCGARASMSSFNPLGQGGPCSLGKLFPDLGGLQERLMDENFIDTVSWAGESKQRSTQCLQPAINEPGLWQIHPEHTPCPTAPEVGTVAPWSPTMPHCSARPRVKRGESVFALPAGPSYLISSATMGQVYSPFYLRERANRGPGPGWPGRPAAGQPGWW